MVKSGATYTIIELRLSAGRSFFKLTFGILTLSRNFIASPGAAQRRYRRFLAEELQGLSGLNSEARYC